MTARLLRSPGLLLVAVLVLATAWLAYREYRTPSSPPAATTRGELPARATPPATPADDAARPGTPVEGALAAASGNPAGAPPPAPGAATGASAPPDREAALVLTRPAEAAGPPAEERGAWATLESLALDGVIIVVLVIGLVAALLLFRRFVPGSHRFFESPLVKVLGRNALSPRQIVYLVEVGERVLVIGATADRLAMLAEVRDPEEVARLRGQAAGQAEGSSTRSFRDLLAGRRADHRENERVLRATEPPAPPGAEEPLRHVDA